MSSLFDSIQIKNLKLANRIVMAPMTRSRATGNLANEMIAKHYALRADAGLLITEGTSPSPNGLGYARIPGIFSKEQLQSWKLVSQAVHQKSAKIFMQLMHTGRVSHQSNLPAGAQVLAPSAIQLSGQIWTDAQGMQDHTIPKEMNLNEIKNTILEYKQAAINAIEAGLDGVELHAANGYLLEQFLNPKSNQRKDEYGRDPQARMKFVLEVAEEVAKAIGPEKVGIRLSPYGAFNDMGEFAGIMDFYKQLVTSLSNLNLLYIHVVDHSSMGAPKVPDEMKQMIRSHFKGAYILSGGYDRSKAEADLKDQKGDLVAFGKPFIGNPDLVERLKNNQELKAFDPNLLYSGGAEGYL